LFYFNTVVTTTVLWLLVRNYPGEPVPEETFTHSRTTVLNSSET